MREALRTCVFEWAAASALNYQRKHGSEATVAWLRAGDLSAIAKKAWMPGVKSPTVTNRLKPLYPT